MGLYFMIGFYSYTVVLTYLGLASAAMGMILTFQGFAKYALFCLAFSGLCDMFDGKVARLKKTARKMKSASESRLILSVMWSVSGLFP